MTKMLKNLRLCSLARRGVPALELKDFITYQNYNIGYRNKFKSTLNEQETIKTDILIIGGGAMGSSTAYWLKERVKDKLKIVVLEKDPTYSCASTSLSVGGVRQQFSLVENIQMSIFGAHFIQNIDKYLRVNSSVATGVNFQPFGYLFLASKKGVEVLQKNASLQAQLGANTVLLSPEKLKERFSWLNLDGIELGCFGLTDEGWFDPWSFLSALKQKNVHLGTPYEEGEVIGFESEGGKLNTAIYKRTNGVLKKIKFDKCVLTAGAFSGDVAKCAGVGTGTGLLRVPLPVEPKKRYVFCVHSPELLNGPPFNTPLMVDPSGVYFRPEGRGGKFICGKSPEPDAEPAVDNLEVDYDFFMENVWPILSHRVPAFENLKVMNAWAGYYEVNTLDHNGVVGAHPVHENLYIACGFSGHGIQHSPAVGRAIMELIIDGRYKSIDLARFGFDRICQNEPLYENNIV